MAATIEQVRLILPSWTADPVITDEQIQAAIDAAVCILSKTGCTDGFDQSCADTVCAYLAAHILATSNPSLSLQSESDPCSGGSQTYGVKYGEGIKSTPYGQTANTMTCGCLAEADMRPPQMVTIGTIGDC